MATETYNPPKDLASEAYILGCIILEKTALQRVIDVLKPHHFSREANQIIYSCFVEMFALSESIDVLKLTHWLDRKGLLESVGGALYLTDLTAKVASSANLEYNATKICELWIFRELSKMGNSLHSNAYHKGKDVFKLLDDTQEKIFELQGFHHKKTAQPTAPLVQKALERLEHLRGMDSSITGIPSGIQDLDKLTAGWQKSDLVIIAARPAMGKTAFVLTISRNAAIRFSEPVAFFSLEMTDLQLTQRAISAEAEIDGQKLRTGNLEDYEWKQLMERVGPYTKAPIYIDDTPALSINQLRVKMKHLKASKGISMAVVDYLQLMTAETKRGNREQEIAKIARSLKELAKELDIVVIALSQLSRAVETRGGDKRPILSDLRESGSIEQDADMVMFLYRPEYYGFETDDEGNSTLGMAELIISKQRNGPTGTVKMQFVGKYGKFDNWGPTQSMFGETPFNTIKLPTNGSPSLDEIENFIPND